MSYGGVNFHAFREYLAETIQGIKMRCSFLTVITVLLLAVGASQSTWAFWDDECPNCQPYRIEPVIVPGDRCADGSCTSNTTLIGGYTSGSNESGGASTPASRLAARVFAILKLTCVKSGEDCGLYGRRVLLKCVELTFGVGAGISCPQFGAEAMIACDAGNAPKCP